MAPATSGSLLDSETDKRKQAQTLKPKQNSIRRAMRGLTKNLQAHTDKVDEMPEDPISHNRTPPLEPESPIAPSTPVKDSSSHNSNIFSSRSSIPQSQSRLGRLMHNLKEDWEAGIDPEYYNAKRERERQAMNGSPGNATEPSQPQSRNSSRGPERSTSNRVTPTRKVSQRKAAKAAGQHKTEVRKLQREESQRKLVKHQRDLDRGYFQSAENSPKFAPLKMLQKANDARIQAQERVLSYAEEMERRRNFVEWEKMREVEERRRAHAPPGIHIPPPEVDYWENPYVSRTRTVKASQPSGPQRNLSVFSFRHGPDHVGAPRPESHGTTHEDPFGQPRHDNAKDSGPSSTGQNTYLYYRPEIQPASDPRFPSDMQTDHQTYLNSHSEPDVSRLSRSPSYQESVYSMQEQFQNYRDFHSEREVPRRTLKSSDESVYSKTAEGESARRERNTKYRAAPKRPSTPEIRGEHEHIRTRLVMPGNTFPMT